MTPEQAVSKIHIGGKAVGRGHPCYVVAEIGVNHDGDLAKALALIDAAAHAGADAVKFQTYEVESLVSDSAPTAPYQRVSTGVSEQKEMLRRLSIPREAYTQLMSRCKSRGITFLSTPFSEEDADFLQGIGVEAMKLGSSEVTNLPLLEHVARMGLPTLLSTGMSTLDEVAAAAETLQRIPLVLLHCVSAYPAPLDEVNLRVIPILQERFKVDVGFSDHSVEHEAGIGAVALGAVVLERHLTLDRTSSGPDHAASSTPTDMAAYVEKVRTLERALGHAVKTLTPSEESTAKVARRSLFTKADLPAGTRLLNEHLIALRPGTGISPFRMREFVGRVLLIPVRARTMLSEDMFE